MDLALAVDGDYVLEGGPLLSPVDFGDILYIEDTLQIGRLTSLRKV